MYKLCKNNKNKINICTQLRPMHRNGRVNHRLATFLNFSNNSKKIEKHSQTFPWRCLNISTTNRPLDLIHESLWTNSVLSLQESIFWPIITNKKGLYIETKHPNTCILYINTKKKKEKSSIIMTYVLFIVCIYIYIDNAHSAK